jgi:hypothetical protein
VSEERKPIRLGPERSWGDTTCGYGLGEPECGKPATRHIMWLNDFALSAACDEHIKVIHSRDTSAMPYEEHAFEGDCGMPGTWWHHPYEDEPEGYCFFPALDDASLLAEEPMPAEVKT